MTKTPEELTADWKEGKLEYGRYWVKNKVWEEPFIDRWLPNYSWEISCKKAIEQVLAPVPTYDEYKAMQAHLSYHEKCISIYEQKEKQHTNDSIEYNKLEKENNNLRDLLRECKPYLSYKINKDKHVGFTPTAANLLTRINAAIGESED
nr:MAG TPA: hypothetical protein [Caudoviricetes sp.]